MLSKEEFRSLAKQELLDAITYYIDRQKIVAQALTDLGFDITTNWSFTDANDEQAINAIQKWVARRKEIPSRGVWIDQENNQWDYYLHGAGCTLTNQKTGEPIEWDAPKLNSFDSFFFFPSIFWQFHAKDRYDKVGRLKAWLTGNMEQLIEELVEDGKLNKDYSLADQ
jgi:hypothetical protein